MSLLLEIEFLTGVCRAARTPASGTPDWPPQPDRVFSALVSAWAARGERPSERSALEWLEAQDTPTVHAGNHTGRTAPDVFVPPNDQRASTAGKTYLRVMPEMRPRQPRRFPVACPEDPTMALVWDVESAPETLRTLDAIARDVGYLGHSASLVRCRFLCGESTAPTWPPASAQRRVYPGRLAELERAHHANPTRPVILPGAGVPPAYDQETSPRDPGWLVLEVVDGVVPDIRAAALVTRVLRHTLMSGYRAIGMAERIPEVVSGHTTDRKPTRSPHVAIVPMAFVGSPHSDGRVFGFALIPPAQTELQDISGFRAAFEKVAPFDPGDERRILELNGAPLRTPLRLAPAGTVAKRSLDPDPYLRPARIWATVTPLVLDRHLKRHDDDEIRDLIARACGNVGLPRPDPANIQAGKHSAIEGAPSARPVSGAPPWTRWRVPEPLVSRSLTHAVVDFGGEITGPVLLGAGRFTGLGLCRRLGD